VVDDAIVVVEAVHAKLEKGEKPKSATVNAMHEITGAIISITLVLAAVFIPVTFITGPTGVFLSTIWNHTYRDYCHIGIKRLNAQSYVVCGILKTQRR
jgi:hypothetical protein